MGTITPQTVTCVGQELTFQAVDGAGDVVANANKNVVLIFRNNNSPVDPEGARTARVVAQTTTEPASGQFPDTVVEDEDLEVPAGEVGVMGPYPGAYNDGSRRLVLQYPDGSSDFEVAAVVPGIG